MKTFEELYESCEQLAEESFNATHDPDDPINNISRFPWMSWDLRMALDEIHLHNENMCDLLSMDCYVNNSDYDKEHMEEFKKSFGQTLFNLALISKKLDINIYEELRKVMEEEKTNLLEEQLGGSVDEFKE